MRSKRVAAWDAAWVEISLLAGIGQLQPSDRQTRLQSVLQRLYEARLPSDAIGDLAIALRLAWHIGRDESSS